MIGAQPSLWRFSRRRLSFHTLFSHYRSTKLVLGRLVNLLHTQPSHSFSLRILFVLGLHCLSISCGDKPRCFSNLIRTVTELPWPAPRVARTPPSPPPPIPKELSSNLLLTNPFPLAVRDRPQTASQGSQVERARRNRDDPPLFQIYRSPGNIGIFVILL